MGIGLATTVRLAVSPEFRRAIIDAVAERLPIEELLDELVLDADVVPDPEDGEHEPDGEAADTEADAPEPGRARKPASSGQRRRPVSRARGDTNGQRGRKPPNRGARA
jgi:hypothetical protein